jgi:hypothetical protein
MLAAGALALVPAVLHSQSGRADEYSHSGVVRDRATGKAIEANVRAYASEKGRTNSGSCIAYEDNIHSTESDPVTGHFSVIVKRTLPSYVITYCRNGYIPRAETTNSNLADGTPVRGDPVALFPDSVNEKEYVAALRAELTRSASELRYMSRARPEHYSLAIKTLSADTSFMADPFQKRLLDDANALSDANRPRPPAGFQVN